VGELLVEPRREHPRDQAILQGRLPPPVPSGPGLWARFPFELHGHIMGAITSRTRTGTLGPGTGFVKMASADAPVGDQGAAARIRERWRRSLTRVSVVDCQARVQKRPIGERILYRCRATTAMWSGSGDVDLDLTWRVVA